MSTIKLDIQSPKYSFNCEIHRRLTVIHGDSAVGKSSLTRALNPKTGSTVSCSLKVVVATDDTYESVIRASRDSLIIMDDLDCVETLEFAKLCKDYLVENNLYVILINRAELPFFSDMENDNGKHFKALSISIDEIYSMKNDGGTKHWLEHDYLPHCEDFKSVTKIITEDTANGFKLFSNYFENTIAAPYGKSSVIDTVIKEYQTGENILVLFDTAAFGVHLEEYRRKIVDSGMSVYYLNGYECFEYFILCTNFLRNDILVCTEFNDIEKYANQYLSWEQYFEDLIDRATYKRFYRCTHTRHSILSDCYILNCVECSTEKRCRCQITPKDGDKLSILLDGTIFKMLLSLPRKQRNSKSLIDNDINPISYF